VQTLFAEAVEIEPEPRRGLFAGVAMEQSIDRVLDYGVPKRLASTIQVGQRVRVPLGRKNRPAKGVVVTLRDTSDYPKIKDLFAIDDERALLDGKLLELARWMSRYYCTPLGAVIDNIIPSAVKKKIGLGYTQVVRLTKSREEIQATLEKTKAPKRRAILARMLQLEEAAEIELVKLASEAGATVATVRKLVRLGLISIRPQVDLPRLTANVVESAGDMPDIQLNEDQQKIFDALTPRLTGGFSVQLLHGVTGSGKTEIYLQAIRRIVAQNKQAIVLVPEIALTPQTVRRFTDRFKRVAILHSGLSATERHRYWQMISQGQADVVVGARSAIFAPTPNLGMIVVDEEHESSYKQDTAPRYHARDVAVKRGQIEGIPVLLGSATPSLESWHRAKAQTPSPGTPGEGGGEGSGERGSKLEGGGSSSQTSNIQHRTLNVEGKEDPHPSPLPGYRAREQMRGGAPYHLLTLPSRVRGLQLPHIELVNLATDARMRRGVHLISVRLEYLLRNTLERGQQAILLLNRRGYSNFVFCPSCNEAIQCKYCDTTMTYHRTAGVRPEHLTTAEGVHTGQLHCHYCLAVNPLPATCPACEKKLSLFGLGTQRVEEELTRKFPDLKFARVDSDSMRGKGDYEKTLGQFARREIQVMLGTQMIAKGLDYPNVTLVGVISGDTALALPDFRAAERTFQLITQVAGRAGRGDAPGRVVLQTFMPDDPTIQMAIKQDFAGFVKSELKHRQEVGLPPFTRMVRIILREQELEKLLKLSEELAAKLRPAIEKHGNAVLMKGPMPCAISRIAGYFRYQIVLSSLRASSLQSVLADVREKGGIAKSDRIAVDVDPVSLL
jgi:primosomal protein N' (replication factor Y) (superfamily II helicase)